MPYLIVKNSFAPKCPWYMNERSNVHSISYNRCNFDCEYCFFNNYRYTNEYVEYDTEQFKNLVNELIKTGNMFKFTGGEPTLNPRLMDDIKIVKDVGGKVFLDTNASNNKIIEALLREKLVDLFGISIKGLTMEEAVSRSRVKNHRIVWDNVHDSIDQIAKSGQKLIITYVCYEDFSIEKLVDFSEMFVAYDGVYLKVNNYQPDVHFKKINDKPKDREQLEKILSQFVKDYPVWKDRIVLVGGKDAVYNQKKIRVY